MPRLFVPWPRCVAKQHYNIRHIFLSHIAHHNENYLQPYNLVSELNSLKVFHIVHKKCPLERPMSTTHNNNNANETKVQMKWPLTFLCEQERKIFINNTCSVHAPWFSRHHNIRCCFTFNFSNCYVVMNAILIVQSCRLLSPLSVPVCTSLDTDNHGSGMRATISLQYLYSHSWSGGYNIYYLNHFIYSISTCNYALPLSL